MAGKKDTREATMAELRGCNPSEHYDLEFDDQTRTVEVKGTIDKDTMAAPPLVVALHGSTTGLSVGVANEAKSVKRNTIGDLIFESEEWCILGAKWRSGSGRGLFSEGGDSGSCLWDMEGRIGGMLTSGLDGGNGCLDVSYATPIEWLLADIREQSGLDVELA